MNAVEIWEQIQEVFQETFDDDELVVHEKTVAADVEEWDSLGHITLIVNLEKSFKVKFTTAQITELENVGDLHTLLSSLIN